MQTRNRDAFTTIHTEGALLPADLLQRIGENDTGLEGLETESYHLAPNEKLSEAINRSWNRLNGLWGAFQTARGTLGANDAGTTVTRERWLLPLFQELGFGRLGTARAVEIEGKSYPISHRWQNVPLHLVGCGLELDKRTPGAAGAARTSPHSLLQEYLNRSEEALWGLVSNGLELRALRDNATLTRQAYVEFDLESMFDGEVYSDFVVLWLVCNQSRFETTEKQKDCILERWSKSAQERGTRALDDLRRGVEEAIVSLGQGFLQHPLNGDLRSKLKKGDLPAQDYYRQVLRLVYRLIFLFAAEDRDLLLMQARENAKPEEVEQNTQARTKYQRYYSMARLRGLAEHQRGSRHYDRYEALRLVMTLLGSPDGYPELAMPALGGFLFDERSTADLNSAKLDNQSLLTAVRALAFITEGNTRRAVDYRNLGPEELGSVYESLLELHPLLNTDAGTFQLSSAAGNERKTTGSYYTPSSLIQVLLDSALGPVIEDRLAAHRDAPGLQEPALLGLKVCDPACGSGHFLIAAAHRIAGRLAQVRAGGDEPSPKETRRALRDVISHCIYGVDVNPMAVELCKVNLWLESLEPGKPLSFLDAHIQCGDSLVGVSPNLNISELPDEAFNPAFGDDKATASALKKRNKRERGGDYSDRAGQLGFRFEATHIANLEDLVHWLTERAGQVDAMPEDDSAQVDAKTKAFDELHNAREYLKERLELDLWTAAFFWSIPKCDAETMLAPTQQELIQLRNGGELDTRLVERVKELTVSMNFFHWELGFPKVFSGDSPGFDCVLGNPPWERIKLQEEEFFARRDPDIAGAHNKAARKKMIDILPETNPLLATEFIEAKHAAEDQGKYTRNSGKFPLTGLGDINTYSIFAELFSMLVSPKGRAGIICPTGIVTDETTKAFFVHLVQERLLVSVQSFENEEFIFTALHNEFKFCLLTFSGQEPIREPTFIFFCRNTGYLRHEERYFNLSSDDFGLLNPNSRTCPIFRTRLDAQLTKKIYEIVPILIRDASNDNPWTISFLRMFDMAGDSNLFHDTSDPDTVPLYEAKMFWHFDHRFASLLGEGNAGNRPSRKYKGWYGVAPSNPGEFAKPRYWIARSEVENRLSNWTRQWLLGYRDVTGVVVERTAVFSILPRTGVGHTAPLILSSQPTSLLVCLLANLNSLVFDYVTRQKLGGSHLSYSYLKQLPVLSPNTYTPAYVDFIAPRVLELVYTAYDLRPFAEDMGYHGEPFKWDDARRTQLRAELDAYYARLYGLTRDELRYILDPKEVYGDDFPGETFRVLKEKEIKQFGEYRTRRMVLEAWDGLQG